MSPIVLVDVGNLACRSYYKHRNLEWQKEPTGAVYGFLRSVLSLRKRYGDRLIFCWDSYGQPNWKKKLWPGYKASRSQDESKKAERAAIHQQFPAIREALRILGYPSVEIPGLEADDTISILVWATKESVLVHSTDHDLYQLLVLDHVRIVTNGFRVVNAQEVEIEYGVPIWLWDMYLALGGDHSDDIKVLPRVGPKTAAAMLHSGLRLDTTWQKQSALVKWKYPKCIPYWPQLRLAWSVARLPKSPTDQRMSGCKVPKKAALLAYLRHSRTANGEEFERFCLSLGMFDLWQKQTLFLP